MTREQEDALKIRPYFVHVKRDQLIGWQFEREGGVDVLSEIRIEEQFHELDNSTKAFSSSGYRKSWDEIEIRQVRVIRRNDYEIWRDTKNGWEIIEQGEWTLGAISLVPIPAKMTGRMVGEPVFRDLAYMNVQHWQSMSDQKNILHVARVPILFGKQLGKNRPKSIGAGVAVFAEEEESDLKYVELEGSSVSSGREDLMDIEKRMISMALEPNLARTGNVTATSSAIDEAKANTQVEAWSLATEDAITLAIRYAFEWLGLGAEKYSVNLNRDFSIGMQQSEDAALLLNMHQTGALSLKELYKELKRRGILEPQFNIDLALDDSENSLIGINERL